MHELHREDPERAFISYCLLLTDKVAPDAQDSSSTGEFMDA